MKRALILGLLLATVGPAHAVVGAVAAIAALTATQNKLRQVALGEQEKKREAAESQKSAASAPKQPASRPR